jgi:tRNA modification GTPase
LAEPGEFTQRAFLNGKLDLAQAEAVNDLIRAQTDQARKVALSQLSGDLSSRVSAINARILGAIAAIEAAIDFPDDVDEPEPDWMKSEVCDARGSLEALLRSFGKGRIYREGLRVVIAGRVNVGKSSLLNALLRHARAIVTPIPGTTRDVIEESLEIQGIPIVAIDTAGLRATDDPVEQVGVELSRQSIESADLILLVVDAREGLHPEDKVLLSELQGRRVIVVANKIDLAACPDSVQAACEPISAGKASTTPSPLTGEGWGEGERSVHVSAATGQGIDELENAIAEIAGANAPAESGLVSNARHEAALRSAAESLGHVLASLESAQPIDLLSGDLIAARNSLGLITGETATEDLLDRIFSEFCIGK